MGPNLSKDLSALVLKLGLATGKKKLCTTTTVESLLSSFSESETSMVYALLSGPMVYALFLVFQGTFPLVSQEMIGPTRHQNKHTFACWDDVHELPRPCTCMTQKGLLSFLARAFHSASLACWIISGIELSLTAGSMTVPYSVASHWSHAKVYHGRDHPSVSQLNGTVQARTSNGASVPTSLTIQWQARVLEELSQDGIISKLHGIL